MSYITTQLRLIKSYPTYQFYAKADSRTLELNTVFHICILETFKWLRERLKNFTDLPAEILTPEPEEYARFSKESLVSFSYQNGLSADVIYIEKKGIWSFLLSESDMGANIGTERERLPVHGRTFNTEIAFIRQKDHVEIGVRTICSEPSDTPADCEVFRPTVVRALAENPDIQLMQSGFILDEKPLEIRSKAELERFFGVFEDDRRNFPIVLVADSKTETRTPDLAAIRAASPSLNVTGGFSYGGGLDISVNAGSLQLKQSVQLPKEKQKKTSEKPASKKPEPVRTKLPVFDYTGLARVLVGFAVVVFADEKYFRQIENKSHISLTHGDILVISRQTVLERYTYPEYSGNMQGFFRTLRSDMIAMPKRKQYDFGGVLFHSDAKMRDYHDKRHETTSLEEQCSIYRLENAELKARIKDLSQHQTDMQQTAEALTASQKKAAILQKELELKTAALEELRESLAQKEIANQKNAELASFYKQQAEIAAAFPTSKDDVCDWIEKNFSDHIILAQRARSEMRKYSGALDVANLCDGIVFLDAYARFRRRELTEGSLQLYAERNNWEVQNCGKEAIKMRRSSYTVTHGDSQYLLDLHIKQGVRSEELIRIYFCWDDDSRKLLIGSMPKHLATVRQNT